jgi:hypothetical protein
MQVSSSLLYFQLLVGFSKILIIGAINNVRGKFCTSLNIFAHGPDSTPAQGVKKWKCDKQLTCTNLKLR